MAWDTYLRAPYGSFKQFLKWWRKKKMSWIYFFSVSLVVCHNSKYKCTHMDTHARPSTKNILDLILSHQTSSHCHRGPMGFISASFKTTIIIPTPTLQSQMLSVEEETTLAWRVRAYETPQKTVSFKLYALIWHKNHSVMCSVLMFIYLFSVVM